MKIVTCIYCKEKFDKDAEEYEMRGKRYAHKHCAELRNVSQKNKNIKICFYCNKGIDISKEKYFKPRVNRYAHEKCYKENYTEDDIFISHIYELLKEVGIQYKFMECERQRSNYIKQFGYTNKGIFLALKYFYIHKKGDIKKSGGRIGIVPYVYEEAQEYYNKINKEKKEITRDIIEQIGKSKTVNINYKTPKSYKNYIDIDNIK